MNSSPLHSVLVNGVVFKQDRVLVSRRSWEEKHMPGMWTIPGGKVEQTTGDVFNVIESTLKREVLEETGVVIGDKFEMVTNNTFIRESTGEHVIALVFKCWYSSGEAKPMDDTIDCKWVSVEEAREMNFPPNVKGYILKAFDLA